DLQDEIATLAQILADSVRKFSRGHAGSPAAESAGGQDARAAEAAVALPWLFFVLRPSRTGGVEVQDAMMDDAAIAGPEFDARDGLVFRDRNRNDEALIDVAAVGRHGKIFRHFQHEIRLAQLPAIDKLRR